MGESTIGDIAKEAGVSKATVSRVLNNSSAVAPLTRKKVLHVMKERSYSPSAMARGLSKRTSSTIGVIVPEVDNPFFGEILRGVTEIADKNFLTLFCFNTDDDPAKDYKALEILKEQRVKGLLYTPASNYSSREEREKIEKLLNEIDTSVVILDRKIGLSCDGVYFDDYTGMYNATKILIDAGHTKIGIINGTLERVLAKNRHLGYLKALEEAGIEPVKEHMCFGNFRMGTGYELAKGLLALSDRPTAVLTCNNRTSLGFLKALHERGESVPEDIACIGLDRIEALDIVDSNFSYILRDALEMGKQAIELLLLRIASREREITEIILDTPVVIRDVKMRTE